LERAIAIVADIGGMTSHTAKISRELGIPCIIGTEFGTQVFQDGDLIEVDADHGTARKVPI
jgi:pyruvate,water dikinase